MTNLWEKILMFVVVFMVFNLIPSQVKAVTINWPNIPGFYFEQFIGSNYTFDQQSAFVVEGDEGKRLYCIEPGAEILYHEHYATTDWSVVGFSDSVKEEIQLISYFGWQYPGHQTNKYYAAAQELIWTTINPSATIKWYSDTNFTPLDISAEKAEIKRLIADYKKTPSFVNTTIKARVGDTIEIVDENGVLSNYKISGNSHNQIDVDGNTLILQAGDEPSQEEITLTRNVSDTGTSIIYYNGNTQKMAYLTLAAGNEYSFNIQVFDKYVPEDPVKSVSTDKIELNKDFEYKISHNVDLDESGIYLKEYSFIDILEDCLELSKVTVTNENDEDVTDLFDISIDGQKITLTAKDLTDADFYGHTYNFNLLVHTKNGYDMTPYKVKNDYIIPNIANIVVDNTTLSTNVVDVIYTPEIVNVPATAANTAMWILVIGILLIIVSGIGYWYVYNKKK